MKIITCVPHTQTHAFMHVNKRCAITGIHKHFKILIALINYMCQQSAHPSHKTINHIRLKRRHNPFKLLIFFVSSFITLVLCLNSLYCLFMIHILLYYICMQPQSFSYAMSYFIVYIFCFSCDAKCEM